MSQSFTQGSITNYADELSLCKNSLSYFTTKYFFPSNSSSLFYIRPNKMQKSLFESVDSNSFTLLKKDRQSGASTALLACLLWQVISGRTVLLITHNTSTSGLFLENLSCAYDNLTLSFKPKLVYKSKRKLTFDNGSLLYIDNLSSNSPVDMLLIDEADFIINLSDKLKCVTKSPDCKTIAVSSNNLYNKDSWFKSAWNLSVDGTIQSSILNFESSSEEQ